MIIRYHNFRSRRRSRAKVLRENLASSSKFGFSVLGVTVTSWLLAKAAATTASLFVFFVTWT